MNINSQNPEGKFSFSRGHNAMDNRSLYLTLAVSASLGLLFILVLYKLLSSNAPVSRLPYAVFVSVLPALGALVVLRLTRLAVPWRGGILPTWATGALLYLLLFLLVFF